MPAGFFLENWFRNAFFFLPLRTALCIGIRSVCHVPSSCLVGSEKLVVENVCELGLSGKKAAFFDGFSLWMRLCMPVACASGCRSLCSFFGLC